MVQSLVGGPVAVSTMVVAQMSNELTAVSKISFRLGLLDAKMIRLFASSLKMGNFTAVGPTKAGRVEVMLAV
jgi:hypothetical protein